MTTFNPLDMGPGGHEMHFPGMDDPLYQHNMLDLNTPLDMQYSSRLMDFSGYDSMNVHPMGQQMMPNTISPMDSYNDPNYIAADSQMLGSSMPMRSDSATNSDDTGSRGQQSNAYSSATTSQSSLTPPTREPRYLNPTAMVDKVLESTIASSKPAASYDAAPQSMPKKAAETSISARPDEIADGIFLVNPTGKIVHCNTIVSALLGWSKDKLVGADIRTTLHPEDVNNFYNTLHDAATRSRKFKTHTRFSKIGGSVPVFELFEVIGTPYSSDLADSTTFDSSQSECRGVVLNCRPYPSPQASQFDGFLQLSSDNLWLKRQLNRVNTNLSPESVSFNDASARLKGPPGVSEWVDDMMHMSSESGWGSPASDASDNQAPPDLLKFYYPDRTDEVSNDVISAPSSSSTGSNNNNKVSKKDKRVRKPTSKSKEGDYICTECGTMNSPEWRKGPQGRKTLCNACGLRWSKQAKKQQQQH
ncbi:Cutinase gene palindrome-binding protein [Yarrowia sp. C11]|nr:Cutinase gene palindrome-binding protein [Yarrowia sp. C11]